MEKWKAMTHEVRNLKDANGMPVDEGIVETVAAMRLSGFHTILSCEGHSNRYTGGPYVMFTSLRAEMYAKQWQQVQDKTSLQAKELQKNASFENALERYKLHKLLVSFYKNNPANYSHILIVRSVGLSSNRLEVVSIEFAKCLEGKAAARLLHDSQAEMRRFTEFLKKKKVGL